MTNVYIDTDSWSTARASFRLIQFIWLVRIYHTNIPLQLPNPLSSRLFYPVLVLAILNQKNMNQIRMNSICATPSAI